MSLKSRQHHLCLHTSSHMLGNAGISGKANTSALAHSSHFVTVAACSSDSDKTAKHFQHWSSYIYIYILHAEVHIYIYIIYIYIFVYVCVCTYYILLLLLHFPSYPSSSLTEHVKCDSLGSCCLLVILQGWYLSILLKREVQQGKRMDQRPSERSFSAKATQLAGNYMLASIYIIHVVFYQRKLSWEIDIIS